MTKTQWVVVLSAIALFGVLFFRFDTKPDKHKAIENKRSLAATSTDIGVLLVEAKKDISSQQSAMVLALEAELEKASSDSTKAELNRELSSLWYSYEKPGIAGYYAEKKAELEGTEEAWSIAGTTYSICVQREKEEKLRSYCTQNAIQSLENATSLNPTNLQHKINLALVYAENPPQDNPMKGVLMLVELNKQHPGNASVLTQLGRLAIKTSQFDKAVQRLQEALAIEPEHPIANCLLAQAFNGQGNEAQAAVFQKKCEELTSK